MDEYLSLVERRQVHGLRIAKPDDAEIRVARGIDHRDGVRKLFRSIDAVLAAYWKARRVGRDGSVSGLRRNAWEHKEGRENQAASVHYVLLLVGSAISGPVRRPVEEGVHIDDLLSLFDDDRLR
jgi:hypothetical protein